MIRAIAIDDEPMALEVIRSHADKINFLRLERTFINGLEALSYIQQHPVDLVFLDINMPDISGLDLSQLFPATTEVVFTTAYSDYAVEAFSLNALDYLVKPIGLKRFMESCQKAFRAFQKEEVTSPILFVKDGHDLVKVVVADILYIKSEGNYLTIKEKTKKTLTRMTMSEVLALLPAKAFVRVHKSYVVQVAYVEKIERHQLRLPDETIPVSIGYKNELLAALQPFGTPKS